MKTLFRKKPPLSTVVSLEIIALMTVMSYFLPGGNDIYMFFRPMAEGCFDCGYNPWHASWVLFPMALVPLRLLWPVWVLAIGLGVFFLARRLGVNPVFVLLSFPMMGQVWLGQIDVIVAAGLVLALCHRNPYVRGAGLALASIKPQLSALPMLVLFWHEPERLKALLIPALVLAASLIVWGIGWPLDWINLMRETRLDISEIPLWLQASLYPYGIAFLPAILLVKGARERLTVALLASALAFPWFGIYSYITFLIFFAPWWALPLSYAWALAFPFMGTWSLALAGVLPLGLLIYKIAPPLRVWWEQRRAVTPAPQ